MQVERIIAYCFCKNRGSLLITSSIMIAMSISDISDILELFVRCDSLFVITSVAVTFKTIGWHKSTSPFPIPYKQKFEFDMCIIMIFVFVNSNVPCDDQNMS